MLQTKCIFAPIDYFDGFRVSIMSRHTLNDGQTLDKRIKQNMFDAHCVNLAAPLVLVGALHREELNFYEYSHEYVQYLRSTQILRDTVASIAHWALTNNITFLCQEKVPQKCHRFAFAQECKRYEPSLYYMAR